MMSAVPLSNAVPRDIARRSIPLVALALLCSTAARDVLSPLQELMKTDLEINDNQVAVLQGLALALPLALVSIPLGRLVDRSKRTLILVALTLCCAVGCLLTAVARDFPTMFVARMLVGVGAAAGTPAAISLASDYSRREVRGRIFSILGMGQVLGGALPFVTVGVLLGGLPSAFHGVAWLGDLVPWRLVQLVFAAGMALAAVLLLSLREPVRNEVGSEFGGSVMNALWELWTFRRVMVPLVLGIALVQMADTAAGIWVVPLLTRVFHQTPEQFGGWMGGLIFVSGCTGTLLGGVFADFCQRRGGRSGIAYGAMVAALVSIASSCMPIMPTVPLLAGALAVFITCGILATVLGSTAVVLILPNELRGISSSVINAISILVSFGVAPSLVSLLEGIMGSQGDIRAALMIVSMATSLLGALAFYRAARTSRE
jgi:MFS family permease